MKTLGLSEIRRALQIPRVLELAQSKTEMTNSKIFTLFLGLDCSVDCFFFVTLVATKNILPMLKRALQLSFVFRIKSKVFILPHRVWCSQPSGGIRLALPIPQNTLPTPVFFCPRITPHKIPSPE